jgi:cytochrome b561
MPKKPELIAYGISIALLAFSFSYVKVSSLAEILAVLPTVFATSIVVEFAKTFVLVAYARSRGVWTEHRLWYFGLATFVLTTFAFRMPFSSPSRNLYHSPKFTKRLGAILASASVLMSLAFAGLFFGLMLSGFAAIGATGLAMCLIGAFLDTFPVTPMNGKAIFDHNKTLWTVFFVAVTAFYGAWMFLL